MMVRPPVGKNQLHFKDSSTGLIHTSGDFTSPSLATTNPEFRGKGDCIDQCFIDLVTYSGDTSSYEGWFKITITGVRAFDGSTLHLGEALYYVTNSDTSSLNQLSPLRTDAAWDSWTNGGRTSATVQDLSSYVHVLDKFGTDGRVRFCHSLFAWNEKDPVYNVQFLGKYALTYNIKIEFLSRRANDTTNVTTINIVPKKGTFSYNSANSQYSNINDGKSGRTSATADSYGTIGVNRSCDIYIDSVNDYIMHMTYVNESFGNNTRIARFSEAIKPINDLDKRPVNKVSWIEDCLFQSGYGSSVVNNSLTRASFVVDESDPGNGGRPTFYHNLAWNGTTWEGRRLGFSSVQNYIDNTWVNSTDINGIEDGWWPAYSGFPFFNSAGKCANGHNTTAYPVSPKCVYPNVRHDNRPLIGVASTNTFGIVWRMNINGTYANPDYQTAFQVGTGTDTATSSFAANSSNTAIDPLLKELNSRTFTGFYDGNEWIYGSGRSNTERLVYRMRYVGAAGNELDLDNWEMEVLFSIPFPTENFLAGPTSDTMTNCTANQAFWVQALDVDNPVNGYPVFYFTHLGAIAKIEHNGGSSSTKSDNWTFTKLTGRPTNTTSFVEGTGFGASGGCLGSASVSNFAYACRKQIVNNKLYGTIRVGNTSGALWEFDLSTNNLRSLCENGLGTIISI